MASIDRTAYPRLSKRITAQELASQYQLSEQELAFVRRYSRGDKGRLSLAILLKTRQHLAYFPALQEVPDQIRLHLAMQLHVNEETLLVDEISQPATSHRYRVAVREHQNSHRFHNRWPQTGGIHHAERR